MNILYEGPNESEWAQAHCPGSVAASKWARGLLGGLSKISNVTALTHTYFTPWPKGRVLWSRRSERLYPSGWECEAVSYPVLKYIQERWWPIAYKSKIKKLVRNRQFDCALFYNCCEPWQKPVIQAVHEAGIPTFPILLDGRDPVKNEWNWIRKVAPFATGFISLSWWMYQNLPRHVPNVLSLHFDGGAEKWCGVQPKAERNFFTLVHTGELDQWRGLDFMIEVVRRYAREGIRFVFCGKACRRVLEKEFKDNPCVVLPGFVAENHLAEICNNADVLLNVRDPKHPDNILNYPSKLPHYLSFGRPVVSTRLQSLAPAYDEVVHFAESDTVEAYLQVLDKIRAWDYSRRLSEYGKIRTWFLQNKTWDVMTRKLVGELTPLIHNG